MAVNPRRRRKTYRSALLPELAAASPTRVIREERQALLRRVARWIAGKRYAPTNQDLEREFGYGAISLRQRVNDCISEGWLMRPASGIGLLLTEAGWEQVRKEPVEPLFSAVPEERGRQMRMLAYYHAALGCPNLAEMYAWYRHYRGFDKEHAC